MTYDEITGFPKSAKTWFEISEDLYFKILEVAQKDYGEEIKDILKPKETTTVIEPLSKRDLLGIISIYNLSNEFPDAQTAKMSALRTKFKKLVVSEANSELNNYLISENLMDRTLASKKKEITVSTVKHNKTKKLMTFILSKYLNLDLELVSEEVIEEPEEIQD